MYQLPHSCLDTNGTFKLEIIEKLSNIETRLQSIEKLLSLIKNQLPEFSNTQQTSSNEK